MDPEKIYVFWADLKELEDPLLYDRLFPLVSKERQEKIERLKVEAKKKSSLGAELLLQEACRQVGRQEIAMEFSYGPQGKPYFTGAGADLFFNLSHSGQRVICALSGKEVGCDVEQIAGKNWKKIEQIFTEEEKSVFFSSAEEEAWPEISCRLWTWKESFGKMVGTGITMPLSSVSFSMKKDQIVVCQKENRGTYYFKEYDLQDGYRYAVCGQSPSFEPMKKISLAEVGKDREG